MLIAWNDSKYMHSVEQILQGYNFTSKLEVVSLLNVLSQSHFMYCNANDTMSKYNPKIYLGATLETIANDWIRNDSVTGVTNTTSWPSSYQNSTQKQKEIRLNLISF